MDLGFYIFYPLKMGMGIPELYGFGESKFRSDPLHCQLVMPSNDIKLLLQMQLLSNKSELKVLP
jgi:hypothetical protein